jgi:protein-S-isoprenylcysteine O-methyltransferase Ste14
VIRAVGTGLVAVGLVLMFIARLQLGDSFSITPQARKLVTRGLYSVVRHPVYVTGIIALSGLCLYVEQPVFLAAVAVLAALQFGRSKAEEAVLEEKFGQEYRDYRSRTWF